MDVASELEIADFVAHYERILGRLGWTRTGGERTQRSAWMGWERQDDSRQPLYLLWFAVQVPRAASVYSVMWQVGRQSGRLPSRSWWSR
jgi:hypothetical protein